MRVFAVANQKGGVGKTTTAVSLAGHLARRGTRVLLVDLDPHGSASVWFGLDPDTLEASAHDLFRSPPADPAALVRRTRFPGLFLLPAASIMATLDRQLGTREGMGLVIARALAQLAGVADCAVLDCPPQLGILLVNALAAADRLLVPVQTDFLALKGLERLLHTLAMVTRARRTPLPYLIVPTLYDRRTRAANDCLEVLRRTYADVVWSDAVPVDTRFREAAKAGAPLPHLAPASRGSLAYAALLDTLLISDGARSKEIACTEHA